MISLFSQTTLSSHQAIEHYLQGQAAIKAIEKEGSKPYVKGTNRLSTLNIVWLATLSPFKVVYALFLRATGNFCLYGFSARKPGLKFLAQANYLASDSLRWIDHVHYRKNLLASSVNVLSPDQAEEVYTHDPVSIAMIPQSIQGRFHFHIRKEFLHFDHQGGQCAGLSDWFAALYLQTKKNFQDEEHHLVAVANELQNGAGKEAALLELGQVDTIPLMGLEKRAIGPVLQNPTAEKIAAVFERLKPGLYAIGTERHRMNFYKGRTCDYLFEPATGLIALPSSEKNNQWSANYLARFSAVKICQLF
jgi:hypothetical protein